MTKRIEKLGRLRKLFLTSTATIGFLCISSGAYSQVLLEFNFENFAVNQVIGGQSFAVSPDVSATHDMANIGAKLFGPPNFKLSLTNFAGAINYPQTTFSTAVPMRLDSIEFLHFHNHNPGYPTYPNYWVDLELDAGSGFTKVGAFLAEPGGYDFDSFPGPGWLSPGTYAVRWIAIPNFGLHTGTEWLGLDNIRLIGVLDSDADGVTDDMDYCPGTLIPETVKPATNRWALADDDLSFDTTSPKGKGPVRGYTTADTAGCSCEQIINELELGNGHSKNGCSTSAMDDWVGMLSE